MAKELIAHFLWSCKRCRQSGRVALSEYASVWEGAEETMLAHRHKSPKCRAGTTDIRVKIRGKRLPSSESSS